LNDESKCRIILFYVILRNYDDKNYNNREKYKTTCIERYGVDNLMKDENIRNKLSNIIFEKYVYVLGRNKTENKILRKKFLDINNIYDYPKIR
jgi:hypothetical protein